MPRASSAALRAALSLSARRSALETLQRAHAAVVLALHRKNLLRRKGVTAVGIGRRLKDGVRLREVCLRVYVAHKPQPASLTSQALLPTHIGGVPVDVIEASFQASACLGSAEPRRRKITPLRGGIGLGPEPGGSRGTLGLMFRDDDPEHHFALTCEHVVAKGVDVVQPGDSDALIGPVVAGLRNGSDDLDAALVELNLTLRKGGPGVFPASVPVAVRSTRLKERDKLLVVGACSGPVPGEVHEDSHPTQVTYKDKTVQYRDQVLVRAADPLLRQGDSGAIVLDENGKAWGVLIAIGGQGTHELGVVTPLARILAHKAFKPGGQALRPLT